MAKRNSKREYQGKIRTSKKMTFVCRQCGGRVSIEDMDDHVCDIEIDMDQQVLAEYQFGQEAEVDNGFVVEPIKVVVAPQQAEAAPQEHRCEKCGFIAKSAIGFHSHQAKHERMAVATATPLDRLDMTLDKVIQEAIELEELAKRQAVDAVAYFDRYEKASAGVQRLEKAVETIAENGGDVSTLLPTLEASRSDLKNAESDWRFVLGSSQAEKVRLAKKIEEAHVSASILNAEGATFEEDEVRYFTSEQEELIAALVNKQVLVSMPAKLVASAKGLFVVDLWMAIQSSLKAQGIRANLRTWEKVKETLISLLPSRFAGYGVEMSRVFSAKKSTWIVDNLGNKKETVQKVTKMVEIDISRFTKVLVKDTRTIFDWMWNHPENNPTTAIPLLGENSDALPVLKWTGHKTDYGQTTLGAAILKAQEEARKKARKEGDRLATQ
jgi:hypothetical protein